MQPWHKVVTLRREVREGRSFNPDEFAIALEQVVAGTAPEDYRDPAQFFARTCFTQALREHAGMVLRRLAGKTENTAPVLTLITQFGGGKTHMLTTLYHLARAGKAAPQYAGVPALLDEAGLSQIPQVRVAVFVGNAWDPQQGRETPWIDLARQLAGDEGVAALGQAAQEIPPGTEAIGRLFAAVGNPVLILMDEVLNFINRYRNMAESFYAFIQNLSVAMTGTTRGVAVISLPRSQIEMTDWDIEWQKRITKVVRRVAKDLIANDETEISEVIRRRLFEDLGSERVRRNVSKAYADWCFERRAQLPTEWTAVDTAGTEKKARDLLRSRFEACYPFHPATLSVFQRKWQALPQYQQTRGTLAMLAQWISCAYKDGFSKDRLDKLITLGSAPLDISEFRSVVLGQLGEPRLVAAIAVDISGAQAHARALDADTQGPLRDIHRRVGTAILFESSGGQVDKLAHLPELRFALGGPEVDATSVDNAALALEGKSFFIRKRGSDGFQVRYQPTLKKVVNDRRASLNEEKEIKPAMQSLVHREFSRGASIPIVCFPSDSTDIPDSPKLTIVLLEPDKEWTGSSALRDQVARWTKQRGESPRLYPGSLIWCIKKPGRDLRERVELLLAWKRVQQEITNNSLGEDIDHNERAGIQIQVKDAEEAAKDEVWAGYRFVVIAENRESDGLQVIDLGAGHASSAETLCGRVIVALKAEGQLSESVGAGYLDRHWPPALKESGAWPLDSLRQSFLNGSLTRLLDPDAVLKNKIVEFVERGDFGLASGPKPDSTYERVWFDELLSPDEVNFGSGVFLLKKDQAQFLAKGGKLETASQLSSTLNPQPEPEQALELSSEPEPDASLGAQTMRLRLVGAVPPELWNRLGTKVIPKLRSGADLQVRVDLSMTVQASLGRSLESELRQILEDLGLGEQVRIEKGNG